MCLKNYQLAVVPGLLQTEAYARALLTDRIGRNPDEVDDQVAARMERQAILEREKPPELWVVIDEAVLHRPVGGSVWDRFRAEALPRRASLELIEDVGKT